MHIKRSVLALAVIAALSTHALTRSAPADAAPVGTLRKASGPIHAQPQFRYPQHAGRTNDAVLYDQSGTAVKGAPSQNFESTFDAYDAQGADDFVVTDAAGWTVSAFNFQVSATADPSTATYDVVVFDDAGGVPGTAVCSNLAQPGTLSGGNTSLSVSLASPCSLAQDTYWVELYVNLAITVGGQMFWSDFSPVGRGANSKWQNPGGGFGTSCTTWSDLATCVGTTGSPVGGGHTAFLFQVVGSAGSGPGCTPSGICLVSTVGTDTSAGACATTDTIDATVGDQLNFCYTVTNNTTTDLDYQTLQNNVDGTLFDLLNQPIPAGGTFQFNHVATVGTTNTYNSTWTARDVPPGYLATVESGGGTCTDRIFADGFDGDVPPCQGARTFIDITGTGTPLGLGDDDVVASTMPFSFDFYGTTSNQVCIANNGYLLFGSTFCPTFGFFSNASLPFTGFSAPAMMPLWDDFASTSGDVYFDTRGTTPNRQFIIEWFDLVHFSGAANSDGATFEVILSEDGTIQFEYSDVSYTAFTNTTSDPDDCANGVCATIGLQNDTTLFNEFSAFEASITGDSGIKWTLTNPQVFTSSDSVTVNVGAPQIVVNPSPIAGSVAAGSTTTLPFSIENHGNRDLTWGLREAAASNLHFPPSGSRFAMPLGDPAETTVGRAPTSGQRSTVKPGQRSAHVPFAGATAFAADAGDDEFESFDLTAPGATTHVGSAVGTAWKLTFVDGDFANAYALGAFGNTPNAFGTIDTGTGALTLIGNADPSADSNGFTGFKYDATTGNLYAAGTTCGSSSHLYTIDPATGATTLVGELTGMGCAIAIAIDASGLMYGIDIVDDALFAIDKATGNASLIGSIGFNANFGQDADFDQSTGILYYAAFNADTGTSELRTVDVLTGATTLIAPIGSPSEQVVGLAIETTGGPCVQPQDLPWLSLDPLTGTTPPAGASPIIASIDAAGTNAGDVLAGTVCATSNDPANHMLATPISVDVTP